MRKFKLSNLFSSNNSKIHLMKIDALKTNPKFKKLYKQEPEKVEEIYKNIVENGFDRTQPLIILSDGTVIDGHSRLLAAIKAGLKEIPVIIKDGIESETDVLIYEEHLQLSRRNLSEAEKMIHLENLLNLKKKAWSEGKDIKEFSDESIAKKLAISPRQVQKMREVEAKAKPEQLELIRSGETTLNKIHTEIKKTEGLTRKSPMSKCSIESGTSSKKASQNNIKVPNYVEEVLKIIEVNLPGTTIPNKLKTDLEAIFKDKEETHE